MINFIQKLYDHSGKIADIFYNPRLNIFATSSKNGFAYLYILPHKLFKVIKNENNCYFIQILLNANPLPSFFGYNNFKDNLCSYTINGLLIKSIYLMDKNADVNDISFKIIPCFNKHVGTSKDRIQIEYRNTNKENNKYLNIPLLDEEKMINKWMIYILYF